MVYLGWVFVKFLEKVAADAEGRFHYAIGFDAGSCP